VVVTAESNVRSSSPSIRSAAQELKAIPRSSTRCTRSEETSDRLSKQSSGPRHRMPLAQWVESRVNEYSALEMDPQSSASDPRFSSPNFMNICAKPGFNAKRARRGRLATPSTNKDSDRTVETPEYDPDAGCAAAARPLDPKRLTRPLGPFINCPCAARSATT